MTSSPFDIDGPASISFSGGRTSAYMLHRVLERGLRPDVHVLFANTGRERPETLDFVHEVETRWSVPVHWVEWQDAELVADRWHEVTYATAARDGQPFAGLIDRKKYLPNPVTRFCTVDLKIKPMGVWLKAHGYESGTSVVGIRHDEPRRVARINARNDNGGHGQWDVALPLAHARVTHAEVMAFWGQQSFDLQLRPHEGNCDLCFLKGINKRRRIIEDRPYLATWWIEQEAKVGHQFRNDSASYASIAERARRQGRLMLTLPVVVDEDPTDLGDCVCTD